MIAYEFEILKNEPKGRELLLVATTEERLQIAAETHIGRRMTGKEINMVVALLSEEIYELADGKDSIFARTIREVANWKF